MSTRAIPKELEQEVVNKHEAGMSLRSISEWLSKERKTEASRAAVASVLSRHDVSTVASPDPIGDEMIETMSRDLCRLETVEEHVWTVTQRLLATLPNTPQAQYDRQMLRLLQSSARSLRWRLTRAERALKARAKKEKAAKTSAPTPPPVSATQKVLATPTPASAKAVVAATPVVAAAPEPARNQPCACGSGMKYKRCCLGRPVPSHPDRNPDSALPRAA